MTLRSLMRRRPSAALVVSFLALFVALGGASFAAFRLPVHSVGNAQLQNFSVGNAKLRPNSVGAAKIIAGAVGARQVNSSQVQLRVTGPCTLGAIQSIAVSGNVTCTPVLPNEYAGSGNALALDSTPASPTPVASETLPGTQAGSSYLVFGNVQLSAIDTAAGPQTVSVSCTMARTGSLGAQGNVTLPLGGSYATNGAATIPLVLPLIVAGSSETVSISCDQTSSPAAPAPQVAATATINALQTASNN
jgi:hypothetical protein